MCIGFDKNPSNYKNYTKIRQNFLGKIGENSCNNLVTLSS
jgi:hypothetical protein